jgi:hypothetical protein
MKATFYTEELFVANVLAFPLLGFSLLRNTLNMGI